MPSTQQFNPTIFRAYDIRGIYPSEINEIAVQGIVAGIAKRIFGTRVLVGHDARSSSPALYKAVLVGLAQAGVAVEEGGMMTSPMLYFLAHKLECNGAIMVTASHNPPEWNGLKIVDAHGASVTGKTIQGMLGA